MGLESGCAREGVEMDWFFFPLAEMRGVLGMVVLFHLVWVLKHSAGRVDLD